LPEVYYLLYKGDSGGAVRSKKPFKIEGGVLGHIEIASVAPPHTVASLKRCIAKAEDIDSSWECRLHVDLIAKSPIPDGSLSLHSDDRPGSSADRPMVFKYWDSDERPSTPSDLPGKFSKESPIPDGSLSLHSDDRPGSSADRPMVFKYRDSGVRPAAPSDLPSKISKEIIAPRDCSCESYVIMSVVHNPK